MIKKYILGLGIFLLSFIGFSNATYQIFDVGLDKYASNWNVQYDIGFLNKGRFISSYLGSSKNIIALNDQYLIFWSNIGLYLYNPTWHNGTITQGFFQYFQSCDEIDYNSTGDFLQNCTSVQKFEFSGDVVPNFMSYIKQGDKVYIEDNSGNDGCGGYCSYYRYNIKVCFSSDEIGKTLCLVGGDRTITMAPYGEPYPFVNAFNLQNDVNFANINRSLLTDPPGFKNNIDGSSNTSSNVGMTGNLLYNTCTNGYVLTQIDRLYPNFRYSCQAGLGYSDYSGVNLDQSTMINLSPIPGQGATFKEVYALTKDGLSWNDWFKKYSTIYSQWYLNPNVYSTNPFYGKNVLLFSYFKILNDEGFIDPGFAYDVLNGCKLLLYSDWNAQYEGTYFSSLCEGLNSSNGGGSYSTGENGSVEDDGEVLPPGGGGGGGGGISSSSGTIVSVDWSGTLSGTDNKNFDGKTFINDFYQKLQENFQKPSGSLFGMVPNYILVFMFALILFRFLSH